MKPNYPWRPIAELPKDVEGEWLVLLPPNSRENGFGRRHVLSRRKCANGFITLIGGHFYFDVEEPIAFMELEPVPEGESCD
jgi:hypothetical protein